MDVKEPGRSYPRALPGATRNAVGRIAGGVVAEGSVWLISMQGSLTRLLGGVVNPTLGDLLREGVAV
jgi:hypothetical protein